MFLWLFYSFRVFTPALADVLSLESEYQQISSGFNASSQYSSPSQYCCGLDGLDLSSNFRLFQSHFQAFRERSMWANYNCHHRHFHVSEFFSSRFSFIFTLWSAWTAKSTIRLVLSFCQLSLGLVFWPGLGDLFASQIIIIIIIITEGYHWRVIFIFNNTSAQAECDTRSIFTGLNSESSFW